MTTTKAVQAAIRKIEEAKQTFTDLKDARQKKIDDNEEEDEPAEMDTEENNVSALEDIETDLSNVLEGIASLFELE